MKIKSLQIGLPKTYTGHDNAGRSAKPWRTAIFKDPVAGPVYATTTGLRGDDSADKRFHGGPDKAINVYCFAHYPHWSQELGISPFPFGAFGENLTLEDVVETEVCIGDIFSVGQAIVQISQPRQPCGTLARKWNTPDLPNRIEKNGMTGWYLRVTQEGEIAAGDTLTLLERLYPKWTVEEANQVMHHRKKDLAASRELAELPPLAESWKEALMRRVSSKVTV